jgi:hypothetical protein
MRGAPTERADHCVASGSGTIEPRVELSFAELHIVLGPGVVGRSSHFIEEKCFDFSFITTMDVGNDSHVHAMIVADAKSS